MTDATDALEAAGEATGEARLDHVIAAWQATRQPELAELVAALGAALAATGAATSLAADPHDLDAWHAQADAAPASIRAELLARIDTTKWKPALAQLEAVARWPADPRTVDALLALIDRAPYRSHPARALWQQVYDLLEGLADPRALAALPDPEAYARRFPRAETKRSIAAKLARLRGRLAELPSPAPVTEAAAAAIAALTPAGPARPVVDEAQLLAEVYANPDDDGPRAVYADFLSSRGDPRGELISLQLLAKPGKPQRDRVKALLREHQMAWLGEIADVSLASGLRYDRGFPAAVTLDGGASKAAIERLTGAPIWRTVASLDVRGDRPGYADFLSHEVFYGLRELTTVSATALVRFMTPAPRRLARMVVSGDFEGYPVNDAMRAGILSGAGLPALRTLGLRYSTGAAPDGLVRVLGSPLGRALEAIELELARYDDDLARCVAELLTADNPNLRSITCSASYTYVLTRTAPEHGWQLRASFKPNGRFDALIELLDQLRASGLLDRLTKLELLTPRYQADRIDLVRVRRAARGLETVVPS